MRKKEPSLVEQFLSFSAFSDVSFSAGPGREALKSARNTPPMYEKPAGQFGTDLGALK